MSKDRPSFSDVLDHRRGQRAPETTQERPTADPGSGETPASRQSPSRAGKSQLGGFFPPEVRRQLKAIAVDEDKTVQQLLGEALNLLFASRGRVEFPSIAEKD